MFSLIKNKAGNSYYIMKDDTEVGSMFKTIDNQWLISLWRPVSSLEYHGVWLVTQDELGKIEYYAKERGYDATRI